MVQRFRGDLPAVVAGIALAVSGASTYWDIATHVDQGRERFLTPAHAGIYAGVTVALAAIGLGLMADRRAAGASALQAILHPLADVRPGLAAAGAGMATALAAAPLDNAWHEIYGIDVTIWSPPHLLAIFGVSVAALGLAMLVAPAAREQEGFSLYFFLLSSFLAGLVIITGEYAFNGPQYRIAYHSIILTAASTLVLAAAAEAPGRWSATRVSVWFQGLGLVSLALLFVLGRTLPFLPLIVPAAVVLDVLFSRARRGSTMVVAGIASATAIVGVNWVLLESLDTIRWIGDDLLLGFLGSAAAGVMCAWLGRKLGAVLSGRPSEVGAPTARKGLLLAGLFVAVILPSTVAAHEVGGDAGEGVIRWTPGVVEAGSPIDLVIEDIEITSGTELSAVELEAWRAEHRIRPPLTAAGDSYAALVELPEAGPWMLLIRVDAGGKSLLATRILEVEDESDRSAPHTERFTLGVDALANNDPPAWLDAAAYGLSVAVAALLLRALVGSLRRLELHTEQRPGTWGEAV